MSNNNSETDLSNVNTNVETPVEETSQETTVEETPVEETQVEEAPTQQFPEIQPPQQNQMLFDELYGMYLVLEDEGASQNEIIEELKYILSQRGYPPNQRNMLISQFLQNFGQITVFHLAKR